MLYMRTLARAVVPRKTHDIILVSIVASALFWAGYQAIFQTAPGTVVYTETQWPRSVPRGGFFYLNFDVAFDRSCTITAHRYIRASDGVEYLAQEDVKQVEAGDRVQYTVTVPVGESLPKGPALIQSKFEYECDFWSKWIRSTRQAGRVRRFEITEAGTQPTYYGAACVLEPKTGFTAVRAYYRRDHRAVSENRLR
nr:putative tail protein [Rhizobium phage RHph_TM26]